jgi:hypothetical protein
MNFFKRFLGLAVILMAASTAWGAVPQLINFQGVLNSPGGTPVANGQYSVTFSIYGSPTGGAVLWSETQSITTNGGVFSTLLGSLNPIPDSAFNDSSRYLGVMVAPDPEMTPRQKLASVAFAQRVGSMMGASGGLSVEPGDPADTLFSLLDDGTPGVEMACPTPAPPAGPCISWTTVTVGNPSMPNGKRGGVLRVLDCFGVVTFRVNGWTGDVQARGKATFGPGHVNSGFYSFVAGAYNTVAAGTRQPTIPGGYCNVASNDWATVGGGTNNASNGITATIGGGQGNTAMLQASTIAGGDLNTAMSNFATVGGGHNNMAAGDFATIGGGEQNSTKNLHATVGGGFVNAANGWFATVGGGMSGMAADTGSTVGGGLRNNAFGKLSTVGGGENDSANGAWSVVGGGQNNVANGTWSTVPGGQDNIANGAHSFAAGEGAWALHDCSFVWADCCVTPPGTTNPFMSMGPNTFNARATGGFFLSTACDPPGVIPSSGVSVPPNGSAWVSLSDSTLKHNIRPVKGSEILDKLSQLPIQRWSYKAQGDGIDHIGPMAQDFYRLFHLGEDDRHISTLDPDGIALAAAKELYARTLEQQAQIDSLKSELSRQTAEFSELKTQLAGLQTTIETVLAARATQGDIKLSALTEAAASTGR